MRLGTWWPRPDQFDPYRFDDPIALDKLQRYAWSPFGAGAHKSIGMHFAGLAVKVILHRVLLDFYWTVDAAYTH
ncbi:cytochrome P450 [Williamsia sp.]|uniref:cytochrome P450 n=1 Tax=Williamsia sp. TaxID=1872085 RepID=UPI002F947E41